MKRRPADQDLVDQDAKGVDIRSTRRFLAAKDFRRHVGHGAEKMSVAERTGDCGGTVAVDRSRSVRDVVNAGARFTTDVRFARWLVTRFADGRFEALGRDALVVHGLVLIAGSVAHEARQTKIQNLDGFATRLVPAKEDVSRFQIEMKNTALMSVIDRIGDRLEDRQRTIGRKPARPAVAIGQSASFEVFHHQVGKPASPRVDAKVGHVDDVRMFQLAERRGFKLKSSEGRLIAGSRDQLQRERLLKPEMVHTVHDAHPALPETLVQTVLAVQNCRTLKRGLQPHAVVGTDLHGIIPTTETPGTLFHASGISVTPRCTEVNGESIVATTPGRNRSRPMATLSSSAEECRYFDPGVRGVAGPCKVVNNVSSNTPVLSP